MNDPRVRALLLFILAITFGVLLFGGYLIHREKPPDSRHGGVGSGSVRSSPGTT